MSDRIRRGNSLSPIGGRLGPTEPRTISAARIHLIVERIESGFYDTEHIRGRIADLVHCEMRDAS